MAKTTAGTITYTGKLIVLGGCWNCGSIQAVPERLYKDASERGKSFYCSSCGKSTVFTERDNDKLKKEAERLRADRDYWQKEEGIERELKMAAERRERAQKAAKTRLKNRIAKGVCPCCKRHFTNVERHIKGQHPEYVNE